MRGRRGRAHFVGARVSGRRRRLELVIASAITGVLGAAVVYVSEAKLGLKRFTPLAQLWTLWALCSASITFGVQHWVIQALKSGSDRRKVSTRLTQWLFPLALAVGFLAYAMSDIWFNGDEGFVVLTALLVCATGLSGLGRGHAAAVNDIRLLSILIVGENLIRFALLAPLVWFGSEPIWFGIALLAGFAANLMTPVRRHGGIAMQLEFEPIGAGSIFVTALVGLVSYATMFGGPLVLGATAISDDAISAVFLVFNLARVPYVLTLGLLPSATAHLTSLVMNGEHDRVTRFVNRVVLVALAAASLGALVALPIAGLALGPLLGTNEQFGGPVWALISASSIISLGSLLISMALITVGRLRSLIAVWTLPVVGAVGALVTGFVSSIGVLAWALLGLNLTVLACLAASLWLGRVASPT